MKKGEYIRIISIILVLLFISSFFLQPFIATAKAKDLKCENCYDTPAEFSYFLKIGLIYALNRDPAFKETVNQLKNNNEKIDFLNPIIKAVKVDNGLVEEIEYGVQSDDLTNNQVKFIGAIRRSSSSEFSVYIMKGTIIDKSASELEIVNIKNNFKDSLEYKDGKLAVVNGKTIDSISSSTDSCGGCIACELACEIGCFVSGIFYFYCIGACFMLCQPLCGPCGW